MEGRVNADCGSPEAWRGLYRLDSDLQIAESLAHPAKAAWGLAFKILEHLEELGLLKPGERVLDFMAGTGRFPLAACAKGYRTTAVELEPKFIEFLERNKEYASRKLGRPIDMEIIQGDARHLSELLQGQGQAAGVVSPPYGEAQQGGGIAIGMKHKDGHSLIPSGYLKSEHGSTPGQIGNLKDEPIGIVSPPYIRSVHDTGQDDVEVQKRIGSKATRGSQLLWHGYGSAPGQIGALPDKPLVAITSPPYSDSDLSGEREKGVERLQHKLTEGKLQGRESIRIAKAGAFNPHAQSNLAGYGQAEGQIGQEKAESYLSAMKVCYSEAFKICPVLVVVVRDPTRNKKLRPLGQDTIALLQEVGYEIHCVHKAILFEEQTQGHLFEESKKKVKGRMSFFKRLQWQKQGGEAIAKWEWVIFAVRPGEGPVAVRSPPYFEAQQGSGLVADMKHRDGHSLAGSGYFLGEHGSAPGQIGKLS